MPVSEERSVAIAVFVKTPGYSPIKTRLAQEIGKEQAERFFRLSVQAIRSVIVETQRIVPLTPYFAVGDNSGLESPMWQDFNRIYTGTGGMGQRLDHVYSTLSTRYEYAILMGADSPQISPRLLREAIASLRDGNPFVIGPCHDGGFYLFGGSKQMDRVFWQTIPYSRSRTRSALIDALKERAQDSILLQPLTDVDTRADLKVLAREWQMPLTLEQVRVKTWANRFE